MTVVLPKSTTEKSAPLSPVTMQLLLGQIFLDKGKYAQAFSMFEVASRSGEPRALNMLGRAYERGWGVPRNPAAASTYFRQAAAEGDGWAMFNLADLYLAGQGVPHDIRKAYHLYVSSSRKGISKSFNMLGLIAESDVLPECGSDKAYDFFLAAAQSGDCWGYLNLGRYDLSSGRIEPAIKWFSRALEEGFSDIFKALEALVQQQPDPRLRAIAYHAARLWQAAAFRPPHQPATTAA